MLSGASGVSVFFPEDKRARNKKQIFYRQQSGAICNGFILILQSFLEPAVRFGDRENPLYSFSILRHFIILIIYLTY